MDIRLLKTFVAVADHGSFAAAANAVGLSPSAVSMQIQSLESYLRAEIFDRSIDVQILRLRRRIETDAGQPRYIKTERGAGYIFDARVEVLR